MPETAEQPQKPKRQYKPRAPKKPTPPQPIVMPAPPVAPGTMAQIDKRLGELLLVRGQVNEQIASAQQQLTYWQTKAAQVQQEQAELLQLLRQLTGGAPSPQFVTGMNSPTTFPPPSFPTPTYGHANELPPNIGSIPANPRQPTPNPGGNVADVVGGEGGFR